jgi:hypothetical protein
VGQLGLGVGVSRDVGIVPESGRGEVGNVGKVGLGAAGGTRSRICRESRTRRGRAHGCPEFGLANRVSGVRAATDVGFRKRASGVAPAVGVRFALVRVGLPYESRLAVV